ncbi:TWiK family of potassium channels protein 7 [Diabrotica virgifera virgifera]|uniref:TWiK family of potassium channels protein 7 n=1 Tax=Diabrotica virgifera virgifera TaxID=50390 RepID=A0A6P7FML5_DIAVI|nr:TWiK family of potassium channels protein 7 [Diabrotica virgifera virgifera]
MENLVQTRTRVYISSTMDVKSRVRNWWKKLRLKNVFQHLGLLLILMVYTLAGGLIFRHFEYPAEISRVRYFQSALHEKRQYLLDLLINNNSYVADVISTELVEYEKILEDSFIAGIMRFSDDETEKWTTLKAVFFSSTVLTTIGYGHIVPMTTEGRAFCIVFALIGIPLTLTVIADWGRLFASSVSTMFKHIPPLPSKFRHLAVARRTSSYALSAVCFLFLYLAVGAGLFVIWEEDWTFFEGFYFCFITMTTIGFGDFVPKQPKYMLLCTLYILVGLALTSTIIELVRRQYAHSWRQLQALRGPLAENFRKFAENAPGLDVLAFQQDLMKVLTVVTMPKLSGGKKGKKMKEQEWENAIEAAIRDLTANATEHKPQQVLQIVIYESSV